MVTDASGAVQDDSDFPPFGEELDFASSSGNTYKYTGLERDADQLDHTLNRQYSSNFGRWMTPDPGGVKVVKLDDPQTWNMYAYVGNNPTTLNDPGGLQSDCANGPDGGGCSSNGESFEESSMHFSDGRYGLEETKTDTPTGAQNQSWWSRTLSFFGLHQSSGSGEEPSSWTPDKPLPNDPKGLGPEWNRDTGHKAPNDERYVNGKGDKVDWHEGQPGKSGWKGRDHWHWLPGGEKQDQHYRPGDTVKKLVIMTGAGAAVRIIIETAPDWAPLLAVP